MLFKECFDPRMNIDPVLPSDFVVLVYILHEYVLDERLQFWFPIELLPKDQPLKLFRVHPALLWRRR